VTFQDFIESFYAKVRKDLLSAGDLPEELKPLGDASAIRSLIEQARLFLIEFYGPELDHIRSIGFDLLKDLQETFPCPFDNFALVEVPDGNDSGWLLTWVLRLNRFGPWPSEIFGHSGDNHFLLWTWQPNDPMDFSTAIRFRYLGGPKIDFRASEATFARFLGGVEEKRALVREFVYASILRTLLAVAAISHPANYLVERTPLLTPRETRQAADGRPRPDRKRPHFIVIDHDGLVNLNPATRREGGTHASPIPHARRGHWMRLSERCRLAREQGKTRTWVRESYVGEREFEDGGTRYRVLLEGSSEMPLGQQTSRRDEA
jgi:hypothetical protein